MDGRENAKDFLRNNQVMMQEIEDAIRSQIAYGSTTVALGNDGEDMTPAGGAGRVIFIKRLI